MRKISKSLLLFVIFFVCICTRVCAENGINSINMDVYIKENGDAKITEVWQCESYSGVEWYHPYYNLGNATISDLSVKENGMEYMTLPTWNTTSSKEEKTGKCGLKSVLSGIRICWGMGNYGSHTYEVSYTISNFVDKLNDCQMVYWTLIPYGRSDDVINARIMIHADKSFNNDFSVWGFGENGVCRVNNGYIEMESNDKLTKNEYMTVLVKFPKDFFASSNVINKNFDYYYSMAIESARTVVREKIINFFFDNKLLSMITILTLFFVFKVIISSFVSGYSKLLNKTYSKSFIETVVVLLIFLAVKTPLIPIVFIAIGIVLDCTFKDKKVIRGTVRASEVEYYREIPCDANIFEIYYVAYQYGIVKNETDLLGAIILKWVKEGKVSIVGDNNDSKKNYIQLVANYSGWTWHGEIEKQLYQMLYEASKDGKLEKKELKNWCGNRLGELFTWFDSLMRYEQGLLISEGKINIKETKFRTVYKGTDELYNEAKAICGLKKYLLDFSLINEREALQVHLFEEYLIIAQLLGVAKKVSGQFKDLYPNIFGNSKIDYGYYSSLYTILHETIIIALGLRKANRMITFSRGGGHGVGRGAYDGDGRR